ncbi:MAG: transcription elongation factor GreA [Lachnospiraceae bacterium]|nr:transcription elongation factor GreA [Lachnospiraceae bacterium]
MKNQMTEQDIEKIKAEIEERKVVERPKLLKALQEARAQGDLSENFEYYAAKRANNSNNSRIRYLERMLRNTEVVEDTSAEDEVGLNDSVTVRFLDDDSEETFKIVTSIRGNSVDGRLSLESPFGKAVLGHKVGDTVSVPAGAGSYEVEITDIVKSSDENDALKAF